MGAYTMAIGAYHLTFHEFFLKSTDAPRRGQIIYLANFSIAVEVVEVHNIVRIRVATILAWASFFNTMYKILNLTSISTVPIEILLFICSVVSLASCFSIFNVLIGHIRIVTNNYVQTKTYLD